jgi:putative membrane protein
VVLAVTAIVAAIRPQTRTSAQSPSSPAPAEQVLADRFARGDIDSDEYEQRLRTLRAARQ